MRRTALIASIWLAAAPALCTSVLLDMTAAADAHPGALDANGCHRMRKTGRRICHAGHIRPGEHRRFMGYDGVVHHFSR